MFNVGGFVTVNHNTTPLVSFGIIFYKEDEHLKLKNCLPL